MGKIIDLTTKEKAEKYFENLNKKNISLDELKSLSDEEVDKAYNDLLEKEKNKEFEVDESIILFNKNSNYKRYFESKKIEYFNDLKKKRFIKKQNIFYINNLAKRVKNNNDFNQFKKNFDMGLISDLKNLKLRVSDFTEKELKRLFDFSLNDDKKQFGF